MSVYVGYMTSKKGNKYLALAVGDPTRKTIVTFDISVIFKVAGDIISDVYSTPGQWFEVLY